MLKEQRIHSIRATKLTRKELDRAHYMTERIDEVFEDIAGEPMYDGADVRPDFASVLRAALPEGDAEDDLLPPS